MRIFQLAQELNVSSQDIMDALDDMGVAVKSNLAALDEPLIAELRELFKPKPKPARSTKDDAIKRALAEKDAREKAAAEAARREEERKLAARRSALERAAARRAPRPTTPPPAAAPAPAPVAVAPPAAPTEVPEIGIPPVQPEPRVHEPAASAPVEAEPAPAAPAAPARPAAPTREAPPAPASRLGKAVIAPPPTTAKEKAELLGRPLSQVRGQPGPTRRGPAASQQAQRPAAPARGAGARRGAAPGASAPSGQRQRPSTPAPVPVPRQVEPEPPVGDIRISEGITVKDLAERMNRKAKDIIKRLFLEKGRMATINHALDDETARWVVEAFGGTPVAIGIDVEAELEVTAVGADSGPELRIPRPPVVTMMGHVDHGKTSLLDAIRKTRVAEREAGGITQHIGAYKVAHQREGEMKEIVFLDTPGHEAFTLMRARGARVTDVVVLVVAADDGVMPQTVEAIHHAKAAGVPLLVAINKTDKPNARPDRVLQQLVEHEVLVEQFGGEVVAVPVSAKTLSGIDTLLEMILLVSDMLELTANAARPATGTVLEAKLDQRRGPVATVLVQTGTLRVGDLFVVGSALGRVRALVDERERRLESAGPATPVVVMGLEDVPAAGDTLQVFPDEQKARQIALYRQQKVRDEAIEHRAKLPTLETLHAQIKAGEVKELPVVVKADVAGSVEVLCKSLEDLSNPEVTVRVIHSGTGAITETDILLASASRALVIGFNVRPERGVADVARREGVDIRLHTVIYNVTDEIKAAMLATLSPVEKEVYLGRAQVRQVFRVAKVGTVAGCYVIDGLIRRDAQVRLLRDNVVIHEGSIASLKRFKDDAREVRAGFECGIGLERYQDIKPNDEIEAYTVEYARREAMQSSTTTS
ncbi:MAG: translation initiation factor IF-2 [Acidobacteria bacterium]|nr:translation initiation factor IF-2 [Acidobacteriota bacterium]